MDPAGREPEQFLQRMGQGMAQDAMELLPSVYEELRALAATYFRNENVGHTLQPTVLVHEVFLRIAANPATQIKDRSHFFFLASRLMRHILCDHARGKAAQKRGSEFGRVTLSGLDSDVPDLTIDVLDLDEALQKLAADNPRRAELVELRFYGGLTMEEAAESLGVSLVTAKREWRVTKAWIARELQSAGTGT